VVSRSGKPRKSSSRVKSPAKKRAKAKVKSVPRRPASKPRKPVPRSPAPKSRRAAPRKAALRKAALRKAALRKAAPRKAALRKVALRKVAPPRPAQYTKGTAKWLSSVEDPRQRRGTLNYFRDGLRNVRRVFQGFDAKSGFSLKDMKRWPHARMVEAQHYIRLYNAYTSRRSRFVITRPRGNAEKEALQRFTFETFPEGKHGQKAWIVHTDSPDTAEIQYQRMPVQTGWRRVRKGRKFIYERIIEEGLRVKVVHNVRGGKLIDQDWLFKEVLGFQPGIDFTKRALITRHELQLSADPYEQMRAAILMMIDMLPDTTPNGKEAYYKILTAQHGPIGASQPKSRLLEEFMRYIETYGSQARESEALRIKRGLSTFAESIIGVRYMGSEWSAINQDARMERSALRERKERQELRRERRRKDYEKLSRFEHRSRVQWARSRIKK
jgi:hypothetical protein